MVYENDISTGELRISPMTKSKKCTLLMHAILKNDEELVKNIIKNDPKSINVKNAEGWTALHIVVNNLNIWNLSKYLLILLENGANPNIQNDCLETALICAIKTNQNKKVIKILLENGADPILKKNIDEMISK